MRNKHFKINATLVIISKTTSQNTRKRLFVILPSILTTDIPNTAIRVRGNDEIKILELKHVRSLTRQEKNECIDGV